ncbi:hypothetical protein ACNHKD_01125 [Methylocystis sp. JAN1]|uniref:hypothetical protein n=1 Tax=Methylocystis sp. JAN1 TaxID=3397211 RepID=UPI003FA2B191
MANSEGPEGQPPSAWVWSQYRGELPADPPAAETPVEAPSPAAAPAGRANSGMIGLGLAAAVIVIAGLTWLFTTKPASEPAAPEPLPATTQEPAPAQKSEAEPAPAPEPAAATAPAPASDQQASKPAEPAPAPAHGAKRKKHK